MASAIARWSEEAGDGAIFHQLQSQAHRAVGLFAEGRRGLVVHGNPFRRVDDFYGQVIKEFAQGYACVGGRTQFVTAQAGTCGGTQAGADAIFGTNEMNADRQRLAGQNGAPDFGIGRLV